MKNYLSDDKLFSMATKCSDRIQIRIHKFRITDPIWIREKYLWVRNTPINANMS